MTTLWQDIRYAFRMLGKNPGFTLVVVLVLSLGISVSVAMFGFVEWRLHPPSPFSNSQRVVHLSAVNEATEKEDLSYLDFLALREQITSLSGLAAVRCDEAILKKDQWSRGYEAAEVSRNFFSVAQVHATSGTVFSEGDSDDLSSQPGVVLSYRLWKSQFGSDPTVIGRSILLDDVSRVVWGIAPRWFHSASSRFEQGPIVDFWIPMDARGEQEDYRLEGLVGRLKPGASIQTLRTETEAAFGRLKLRNPETLAPLKPVVMSDADYRSLNGYPAVTLFLIGIGCAIGLIACLNVSGSLLAKADTRRTEMAVRQALGGSRIQLIRQLLTEGALLAALALGVGLLVSYWLMRLVLSLIPADMAQIYPLSILHPRVVIFSLSITLVGTLLFEFFPVWHACGTNPIPALKGDGSPRSHRGRRRYGFSMLVIFELAMALVLTYCAGLLFRNYLRASFTDLGFQKKNVLLARLQPGGNKDQNQTFFRDLVAHVQTLPGVKNVGLGSWAPTDNYRGGKEYRVSVPGDKAPAAGHSQTVQANIVDAGYFQTTGIPVVKGVNFPEQTGPLDSRKVIVSETFASRFWPGKDPVGRFIQLVDLDRDRPATEVAQVVGVVRDVRKREIGETPDPYLYVPWGPAFSDEMTLLVDTQGDPHLLADPIRKIIERLDSRIPVYPMTTFSEEIQNWIRGRAADAKLIGSLSLIGMALASIGLYGIVAFTVTRRTHEMGIRMALGARSRDVMRTVMGQGLTLSLIGLGMGLIGSSILSHILRASLFGVGSFDLVTFAGSSVALLGTALLACYVPARRAAKVDPMVALRYE